MIVYRQLVLDFIPVFCILVAEKKYDSLPRFTATQCNQRLAGHEGS